MCVRKGVQGYAWAGVKEVLTMMTPPMITADCEVLLMG